MRKAFTAVLLLFIVGCSFFSDRNMSDKELKELEGRIIESIYDKEKLKSFLLVLDRAIEKYPNDTRLLNRRFDLYCRFGALKNAKKDLERLIALTDNNSYRFFDCILVESIKGKTEETLACYRHVYEIQKAKPEKYDIVLVLSALMAELSEAADLRTQYLDELKELNESYEPNMFMMNTEVLIPFDREKFLYENSK